MLRRLKYIRRNLQLSTSGTSKILWPQMAVGITVHEGDGTISVLRRLKYLHRNPQLLTSEARDPITKAVHESLSLPLQWLPTATAKNRVLR